MVWWWIGNVVLLLVVAPLLVFLLHRLLRPLREIRRYADDTLQHGELALAALDATEQLDETRRLVAHVGEGVRRYGAAVDRLL